MSEEMQAVALCEKFGWTYEEYLRQPLWLIQASWIKMSIDADAEREEAERAKSNINRLN